MSNTSPEGATNTREDARVSANATPLMLCVDTASDLRSVAVVRGTRINAIIRDAVAPSRSSVLLEEIDAALRSAGASLQDIELYAVANGPGSFTGLRAGLATIKAFASIHARPIAAVPTLHAVALSAGASIQTLAMIPAGRGEVFAQTVRVDEEGHIVELSKAAHVSPALLLRSAARQTGSLNFAGGGARAHAELIVRVADEEGIRLIDEASTVTARCFDIASVERVWMLTREVDDYAAEIARLGLISYEAGQTVQAKDLAASYVRPSDAELNERCHR
ncbi:MAG: tRNA threonylcarbamoyladenosine biosynthesis protein TsaB [Acidobacteriota bacterium]|nr:tRNA threonylcarbamoyladenosine biosynthesis protein TsaB [Acidobacteriota bacterium]